MNASEFVIRTVQAGPDGLEFGTMTLAEVRRMVRCGAPPPEPPTTAQLATAGRPVGAASDVLRVAVSVRCRIKRDVVGVVLHLDRSARGLTPLWLAELIQYGEDGQPFRELSVLSRSGGPSDGSRLDLLDAVPIPDPPRVAMETTVLTSCLNYECGEGHRVRVRELITAGRRGMEHRGSGDTPQHTLRLPLEQR